MLENVELFADLAPEDSEVLIHHSVTRSYPKNAILINEGDDTDSLYIIQEGKAKVFASDESGKEVILRILGPGEYFGELALVDHAPRSASVMALTPCKLIMISRSAFQECLQNHPTVAYNLIQALAQRVRHLNENVKSLALMDVYGRVARTLLDMAEEQPDGRLVIEQKLTHQDIANMVGASREMVSRIFKDLTFGNYISVDKGIVTINEKLPTRW